MSGSEDASYWREASEDAAVSARRVEDTPAVPLALRTLDQIQAIWEDRLAIVRQLAGNIAWIDTPAAVQDRLHEWAREPLVILDAHADNLRARIRLIEGLTR